MRQGKSSSSASEQKIIKAISERLSINNIYRQFDIIANMNKHLEIKFKSFCKLQPFKNLDKPSILKIVESIPFLAHIKSKGKQDEYIKINYQNANRVLLVTGILRSAIDQMINQFTSFTSFQSNNSSYHYNTHKNNFNNAKIIANNGFWITIEAASEGWADRLKKFIRTKKLSQDVQYVNYKVQGRRIRIVVLNQDFLSILIDAMTEIKSEMFYRSFQSPNLIQRRKYQEETLNNAEMKNSNLVYKVIATNTYGSRDDIRQDQFSDGFSESNSLSSDIYDNSKIKEVIQTSEQGIQSENNAQDQPLADNSLPKDQKILQTLPQKLEIAQPQVVGESSDSARSVEVKKEGDSQKLQETEMPAIESQKDILEKCEDKSHEKSICKKTQMQVEDDPFISPQKFTQIQNPSPPSAAIQTFQDRFSSISYEVMRRLHKDWKGGKNPSQLLELPDWMKSQSEEQRNRHRFFASLCQPKILNRKSR